eukprot:11655381-Alexandrium_andersonii.AAC.1
MQLTTLEQLLSRPMRRDRLIATCIRESGYEQWTSRVAKFSYRLYTKRWNNVSGFCKALMGVIGILKQ